MNYKEIDAKLTELERSYKELGRKLELTDEILNELCACLD